MIHNSFTVVHNDLIVILEVDPVLKKVGEGLWDFSLACSDILKVTGVDCEVDVLHQFLLSMMGTVRFEKAAPYVTFAEVRELTRLRKIIARARSSRGWKRMMWAYENMNTSSAMALILEEKALKPSVTHEDFLNLQRLVKASDDGCFSDRLTPAMQSMIAEWEPVGLRVEPDLTPAQRSNPFRCLVPKVR